MVHTKRGKEEQSIRDSQIRMKAYKLKLKGFKVFTNPGTEKNYSCQATVYLDIIAIKNRYVKIYEVETENKVTRNEVEQ